MSKARTWSNKAVFLTLALVMVFSLAVAALPVPKVQASPGPELRVDVNAYLKNPTGEFSPMPEEIDPCTYFYVNAVVANPGDELAQDVDATITIVGPAILVPGESATKDLGDIEIGTLADVWWQLHCEKPGPVSITVVAKDGTGTIIDSDGIKVEQKSPPAEEDLLEVTEVERPSGTVTPGTTFGIKADINNISSPGVTAQDVWGVIDILGPASIIGGDPNRWPVGDIAPGDSQEVGWTLRCDGPGDVSIKVWAASATPGTVVPWEFTVHQQGPIDLVVEIDMDKLPEQVCTGCSNYNAFTVEGTVTNKGDEKAYGVSVEISKVGPGDAFITPPLVQILGDLDANGGQGSFSWDVTCTSAGDVTFTVEANGQDSLGNAFQGSDSGTVEQKNFIVDITTPVEPVTVSTEQEFPVEVDLINCTGSNLVNLTATLTIDPPTGAHIEDYPDEPTFTLCNCCDCTKTWSLKCDSTDDVTITVEVTKSDGTLLGTDTVFVEQEWKTHLVVGTKTYLQDNAGIMQPRGAFTPGQQFHVVIPVFNTGEADALGVTINCIMNGSYAQGSISGDWTGSWIGNTASSNQIDIPGGEARKMILLVTCTDEGDVTIEIEDWGEDIITGVQGYDENTGELILEDNKDIPCPLTVKQIPLLVEIIEPLEGDVFTVCDDFTVKAKIFNESDTQDISGVSATLTWTGDVELVQPQSVTKYLGDLPAGVMENEVTWQMHCTGSGAVTFTVTATAINPNVSAISEPVTIYQEYGDTTSLEVDILSPLPDTFVATSQEFALTAAITNSGSNTAYNVKATVNIGPDGAASVGDSTPSLPIARIPAGESATVTWTLHCNMSGMTTITIAAQAGNSDPTESAEVVVWQYGAAHLEVEIIKAPKEVEVCDLFPVTARVTNTGEADAWEVSATLSVDPEGSVRPSAGDNGYTQYIGTLAGHGQNESVEVTWLLHCKVACESTITITAQGLDEYGWHMKQYNGTTGNFIIEGGEEYFEVLEDGDYDGMSHLMWTHGYFVGDANGLIGPFNVDSDIQFAKMGGGPAYTGHLAGTGRVIPDGHDDGDLMEWIGHIKLDSELSHPMILDWDIVVRDLPSIIRVINGDLTGSYMKYTDEMDMGWWEVGLLCGTYSSNMAAEAGRAIDPRFIEPDSVTVKQNMPANLVVDITYPTDGDMFYGPTAVQPADEFVLTATITNTGQKDAENVDVTLTNLNGGPAVILDPVTQTVDVSAGASIVVYWDIRAGNTEAPVILQVEAAGPKNTGHDVVTIMIDPPPTLQLFEGINTIIYEGANCSLPEALTNIGPDGLDVVEIIWARGDWTGGEWWCYDAQFPAGSDFYELVNGESYLVVVTADCTWSLPH